MSETPKPNPSDSNRDKPEIVSQPGYQEKAKWFVDGVREQNAAFEAHGGGVLMPLAMIGTADGWMYSVVEHGDTTGNPNEVSPYVVMRHEIGDGDHVQGLGLESSTDDMGRVHIDIAGGDVAINVDRMSGTATVIHHGEEVPVFDLADIAA